MAQPKVVIVILNWNGRNYLEQFLPSVLTGTYLHQELVVADNGSSDDSVNFLQNHYPMIRIVQLDQNYGFAKGYNLALKQIQSEYYILLNSDVEVQPGWIEPVIELMEENKSIGACQPKLLSYADKNQFEYAGGAGGWLDYLGYPFARGRIFDISEKDEGQYDTTEPIFWASGAALFVKARLFHDLGGFDEFFFAHQEEIDFCWRLQLAGFRVFACPKSVVYHLGAGTLAKGNERKVFLNFRNNLVMLAKNLPRGQAVWKIPARIFLDSISAWKSLFAGQGIYFVAIITAHIGFFKWIILKRRNSLYPPKRKGNLEGWFVHSVVWRHFVSGKNTFNEIVTDKS